MLAPKSTIPTVAQAVEKFLASRSRESWREHASVLAGPPTGRVTGRQAAGPTLARSELGGLRFDRVTGEQFVDWLHARHPDTLSASTFKRGRSSLRQLLVFALARGWTEDRVMKPLDLVKVEELVTLRPHCMNALDGTLTIHRGKGFKQRRVPVSSEFIARWTDYVSDRNLGPTSWMFPLSAWRFDQEGRNQRVVLDASRHCDVKAVRAMLARLQDLAKAAGPDAFPAQLVPSFVLTPHTLRRTYACSNLIASSLLGAGHGLDLRSLQEAMGHESLETTAQYLADVASYLSRHRPPVSVAPAARELLAKLDAADADAA